MSGVQLLIYMPVIHKGYERLLAKYGSHAEVLVIGQSFGELYPVVRKEIRALAPARVVEYLTATRLAPRSRVIELDELPAAVSADLLVVPDEELTRDIVKRYRLGQLAKVHYEKTFLRWDRDSALAKHEPRYDAWIGVADLERELGGQARNMSAHSSDWWRRVGALAARGGEVIASAYNKHYPSEYAPYIDGDPRNNFKRGLNIELSSALHAEAAIVATAAKDGVRLAGSDLYVSTFPCPGCARLVAASGIARCFYSGGYSMLDGERVLDEGGVKLIFVDLDTATREQMTLADLMGSPRDGS